MGSHVSKPSNKAMVDRLYPTLIRNPDVESAFRAVDRAMYCKLDDDEDLDPYKDEPWRNGNLHLSEPCVYARVVEALDLKPGLSFLNLGSGTGYLNTIIGLLIGPNGTNHGIEYHSDVVDYAYKRLEQFKKQSYAIDKYEFSEPIFINGNFINLNPDTKYDRIYLGAACLPELEMFMKRLIKPNGGILVMPYKENLNNNEERMYLTRYIRQGELDWKEEKLIDVRRFALMINQQEQAAPMIVTPLESAKSLRELCRITIRQQLRRRTNQCNPNLLYSDNYKSRQIRKTKEHEKIKHRAKERQKLKHKLSQDREVKQNKWKSHKTKHQKSKSLSSSTAECTCDNHNNGEVVDFDIADSSPEYFSSKSSNTSTVRETGQSCSSETRDKPNTYLPKNNGKSNAHETTRTTKPCNHGRSKGESSSSSKHSPTSTMETNQNSTSSSSGDDEDDDEDSENSEHFGESFLNGLSRSQRPVCASHAVPILPLPSSYPRVPIRLFPSRQVILSWSDILGHRQNQLQDPSFDYMMEQDRNQQHNIDGNNEDDDTLSRASWDSIFDNFTSNPLLSYFDSSPPTPSFSSVLSSSCSSSLSLNECDYDYEEDEQEEDEEGGENHHHHKKGCVLNFDHVSDYDEDDEDMTKEYMELSPTPNYLSTLKISKKPSGTTNYQRTTTNQQQQLKMCSQTQPGSSSLHLEQEPVASRLRSKSLSKNLPSTSRAGDNFKESTETNPLSDTVPRASASTSASKLPTLSHAHKRTCPMYQHHHRRQHNKTKIQKKEQDQTCCSCSNHQCHEPAHHHHSSHPTHFQSNTHSPHCHHHNHHYHHQSGRRHHHHHRRRSHHHHNSEHIRDRRDFINLNSCPSSARHQTNQNSNASQHATCSSSSSYRTRAQQDQRTQYSTTTATTARAPVPLDVSTDGATWTPSRPYVVDGRVAEAGSSSGRGSPPPVRVFDQSRPVSKRNHNQQQQQQRQSRQQGKRKRLLISSSSENSSSDDEEEGSPSSSSNSSNSIGGGRRRRKCADCCIRQCCRCSKLQLHKQAQQNPAASVGRMRETKANSDIEHSASAATAANDTTTVARSTTNTSRGDQHEEPCTSAAAAAAAAQAASSIQQLLLLSQSTTIDNNSNLNSTSLTTTSKRSCTNKTDKLAPTQTFVVVGGGGCSSGSSGLVNDTQLETTTQLNKQTTGSATLKVKGSDDDKRTKNTISNNLTNTTTTTTYTAPSTSTTNDKQPPSAHKHHQQQHKSRFQVVGVGGSLGDEETLSSSASSDDDDQDQVEVKIDDESKSHVGSMMMMRHQQSNYKRQEAASQKRPPCCPVTGATSSRREGSSPPLLLSYDRTVRSSSRRSGGRCNCVRHHHHHHHHVERSSHRVALVASSSDKRRARNRHTCGRGRCSSGGRRRRKEEKIEFESNVKRSMLNVGRRRKQKRRSRRAESECERYHKHISGLIRELPVPKVLKRYLNLDRGCCC